MREAFALSMLLLTPLFAADQEERTWSELPALAGRNVRFAMPKGAVVSGTLTAVEPDGLVLQVKKTTDKANYPKGRLVVPRADVKVFDVLSKTNRYRVIGTAAGAAGGLALGGYTATQIYSTPGALGAFAAITAGSTAAGYFLGEAADNRSTTIVVRP